MGFIRGVIGAIIGGALGGPVGAVIGGGLGLSDGGRKERERERQQSYECPHCGEQLAFQGPGVFQCAGCDEHIIVKPCPHCRDIIIAPDAGAYRCPSCRRELYILYCADCGEVIAWDTDEAYCKGCGKPMSSRSQDMQTEYLVVTFIALGVAMAQSDGRVDEVELDAIRGFFREAFDFDSEGMAEVNRIIGESRNSHVAYTDIAREAVEELDSQDRKAVLEYLFHIAMADGIYHPDEKSMLRTIAKIFGLSRSQFEEMERSILGEGMLTLNDYCEVLGVSPDDPPETVKRRYRILVKEHHPDTLSGMSDREKRNATIRFTRIQEAYEGICKYRNM